MRLGYYDDSFLPHFVQGRPARRPPLINLGALMAGKGGLVVGSGHGRSSPPTSLPTLPFPPPGYYCRAAVVWGLVRDFLDAARPEDAQVVSLGAGGDTLFFRLHAGGRAPRLYVEVDFHEVGREAWVWDGGPKKFIVGYPPK